MKREIPIIILFASGLFMIVQYLVPHYVVNDAAGRIQQWAIIITSAATILGVANLVRVSLDQVMTKKEDWMYKWVILVSLVVTSISGIFWGIEPGTFFNDMIYFNFYTPMASTMYATLAFFIASAAFRAFRVRSWQAWFLAVTAVIVMLGRVPFGKMLWNDFPLLVDWIMNVPNTVAQRAILIGAAMGAVATGLKMIFGIERSWLGGSD
ncbi:MAG: hypothetical protein OEM52_12190 [bacterium]|nr:hypothetical protein [bacterium]